jgi:hypothetical protein
MLKVVPIQFLGQCLFVNVPRNKNVGFVNLKSFLNVHVIFLHAAQRTKPEGAEACLTWLGVFWVVLDGFVFPSSALNEEFFQGKTKL